MDLSLASLGTSSNPANLSETENFFQHLVDWSFIQASHE
uniref:Uncharacterized protein n=1 Tax=Curvibacter symbiont subsp. Hydra magnipapillata TaxID=667019 RepID=C9Y9U3_CURXX|nr:hypothetical protein Csp_A08940 [Curvibacter putative symbiont of Hydra magnipapillata]